METFLSIFTVVGKAVHWLTGWLAHPDRGGCCEYQNPKELFDKEN